MTVDLRRRTAPDSGTGEAEPVSEPETGGESESGENPETGALFKIGSKYFVDALLFGLLMFAISLIWVAPLIVLYVQMIISALRSASMASSSADASQPAAKAFTSSPLSA